MPMITPAPIGPNFKLSTLLSKSMSKPTQLKYFNTILNTQIKKQKMSSLSGLTSFKSRFFKIFLVIVGGKKKNDNERIDLSIPTDIDTIRVF
mgnify:CR=1 FL=1